MNNGTREVKVIKPTLGANAERKLRVAAYCRVSTDSSDQINSFITPMPLQKILNGVLQGYTRMRALPELKQISAKKNKK